MSRNIIKPYAETLASVTSREGRVSRNSSSPSQQDEEEGSRPARDV